MAYQTGTATDLEDLLSKLHTFATGAPSSTIIGGWTSIYASNPDTTNRWFELSKAIGGGCSFSIRYPSGIGTGDTISVHHATAPATSGTAPGAHTNDSGNGYNVGTGGTSANFDDERCVHQIGNGPFPSYHFFGDTTTGDYIHVVVETTTGTYRHFGMGALDKFGDNWVGGSYVYGQMMQSGTTRTYVDTSHTCLLDGISTSSRRSHAATIRLTSGLPNQGAIEWGVCNATASASLLTDTAGNARAQIHGTWRTGWEANAWGNVVGSGSSGIVGGYSVGAYYRDPTLRRAYLLGYMADVRAVNNRNFEPGVEVTIGADTWIVFPLSIRTEANVDFRSTYGGIMYKKVT